MEELGTEWTGIGGLWSVAMAAAAALFVVAGTIEIEIKIVR